MDMSWSIHIAIICSKSHKLIGLMYHQFHLCKPETSLKVYKAHIQPHMECASIMWDQHHCKDIHANVRKPSKVCSETWHCSYQGFVFPIHWFARACELTITCEPPKQAKLCHLFKLSMAWQTASASQFLHSLYPHSKSYGFHYRLTTKCSLHCIHLSDHCQSIFYYLFCCSYFLLIIANHYIVYWVIMLCISSC